MFVLASGSPRRRALLHLAGVAHEVVVSGVDETVDGDDPVHEAVTVARRKAGAVAHRRPGATVLGADTTLSLDGESLGTPIDRAHARTMLRRLSGSTCVVTTGVVVVDGAGERSATVTARLRLRELSDEEIERYLATGAADDKAGALEVQDRAADFVERLDGCPGTVVGLPICALREDLGLAVTGCHPDRCLAHYRRSGG